VGILLCITIASPAQLTREEDLKAALLLSFVRFTEWPAPQSPDMPIIVGIFEQPELQASMIKVSGGKTVQGRAIQVRGIRNAADLKQWLLISVR
jgi:hypothetical protein